MFWRLLILFGFILGILITPVKVKILYKKNDENVLDIRVIFLWGLINIPLNKYFKNRKKDTAHYKNKGEEILNTLKKSKKNFNIYKKKFLKYREKILIEKFNFFISLGLEDPAMTGISVGFLWWIGSIISGFILGHNDVKNFKVKINPVFYKNHFEVYLDCIIKCKLVYIIIGSIHSFKIKKGGE